MERSVIDVWRSGCSPWWTGLLLASAGGQVCSEEWVEQTLSGSDKTMKNLICLHFDHNLDEPTQFLHEFTECSSLGTAATMMTMKDWLHARFWGHCTSFYSVQCRVCRIAAGSPTIFWALVSDTRAREVAPTPGVIPGVGPLAN